MASWPKGVWPQVGAGNTADTEHIGNNPLSHTLANRWAPPLVTDYYVNNKVTYVINKASILKHPGGKLNIAIIN
eukprot:1066565-Ditylum_brightwellii.AAC.1